MPCSRLQQPNSEAEVLRQLPPDFWTRSPDSRLTSGTTTLLTTMQETATVWHNLRVSGYVRITALVTLMWPLTMDYPIHGGTDNHIQNSCRVTPCAVGASCCQAFSQPSSVTWHYRHLITRPSDNPHGVHAPSCRDDENILQVAA